MGDGAGGEVERGSEAVGHRDGGKAGVEWYVGGTSRAAGTFVGKEAEALEFAAGRKTETILPGWAGPELKDEERGRRWPGAKGVRGTRLIFRPPWHKLLGCKMRTGSETGRVTRFPIPPACRQGMQIFRWLSVV